MYVDIQLSEQSLGETTDMLNVIPYEDFHAFSKTVQLLFA